LVEKPFTHARENSTLTSRQRRLGATRHRQFRSRVFSEEDELKVVEEEGRRRKRPLFPLSFKRRLLSLGKRAIQTPELHAAKSLGNCKQTSLRKKDVDIVVVIIVLAKCKQTIVR